MDKILELAKWLWESAGKGTRAWRAAITALLSLFMAWSTGIVGIGNTHGFAWADEENSYHTKMSLEVAKITESINDLGKQFKDADLQRAEEAARRAQEVKEASIRQLRRQIFETERDGCNAKTPDMKDLLLAQAQQLRSDFMKLTGTEYPAFTSCAAYK